MKKLDKAPNTSDHIDFDCKSVLNFVFIDPTNGSNLQRLAIKNLNHIGQAHGFLYGSTIRTYWFRSQSRSLLEDKCWHKLIRLKHAELVVGDQGRGDTFPDLRGDRSQGRKEHLRIFDLEMDFMNQKYKIWITFCCTILSLPSQPAAEASKINHTMVFV